jgi:hypothetical protein
MSDDWPSLGSTSTTSTTSTTSSATIQFKPTKKSNTNTTNKSSVKQTFDYFFVLDFEATCGKIPNNFQI